MNEVTAWNGPYKTQLKINDSSMIKSYFYFIYLTLLEKFCVLSFPYLPKVSHLEESCRIEVLGCTPGN